MLIPLSQNGIEIAAMLGFAGGTQEPKLWMGKFKVIFSQFAGSDDGV
jgi:hypothetical protein